MIGSPRIYEYGPAPRTPCIFEIAEAKTPKQRARLLRLTQKSGCFLNELERQAQSKPINQEHGLFNLAANEYRRTLRLIGPALGVKIAFALDILERSKALRAARQAATKLRRLENEGATK